MPKEKRSYFMATLSIAANGLLCVVTMQANTVAPAQPAQTSQSAANRTQIVMLGTGNPPADPDRSGPATAIVVNGTPYLVDVGAGVVRRAKSAAVDKGIAALEPVNLRVAFLTHLHSDHTVGFPDLILTPWVIGRRVPLEVYGPAGVKAMTEHLLEAYRADFETRTKDRKLYTVGACEGTLHMAEESALHEIGGLCTARNGQKRMGTPRRTIVHQASQISFPCACFAC
jgi:ribonuclease BN (tRNA processing enzyme)